MLKAMCSARRVDRDIKSAHTDLSALLDAGALDRDEPSRLVFPQESVKAELLLQAA